MAHAAAPARSAALRAAGARAGAPTRRARVAAMATKKIGQERVFVPGGAMVDVAEKIGTNVRNRRRFLAEVSDIRKTENDIVSKPQLLKNVQRMRLLSKAEKLGLLSLLEKNGLSLTKIEELGLLSTAEKLGVLSAAEDRDLPTKLLLPAFALLAAAPAEVYLIPNDSQALVVGQYVLAALLIAGGSAAFGASQLVSKLQR